MCLKLWIALVCLKPMIIKANNTLDSSSFVEKLVRPANDWIPYNEREWQPPYEYKKSYYDILADQKRTIVKESQVEEEPDKFFPLSLEDAKSLNTITDQSEYMKAYINLTGLQPAPQKVTFRGFSRKAVPVGVQALSAICQPVNTIVKAKQPEEKSAFIIPHCFHVPRCGGCCNHHLLECRPTKKKMETYIFTKFSHSHDNSEHKEEVEVHQSCKCECKIQKEDCNLKQNYDGNSCSCRCRDTELKARCTHYQHASHYWDEESCECKCKRAFHCSTGLKFDHSSCACKRVERMFGLSVRNWP